mmetsp:Transcript_30578/g.35651  ORF Transcript_30578/g.35651 Transcript_30578/m.35651 type:complete len:100 (+) Transcript_30578:407-706(+)
MHRASIPIHIGLIDLRALITNGVFVEASTPLGLITPTAIKTTINGIPTVIASSTPDVKLPIANPIDEAVTVIKENVPHSEDKGICKQVKRFNDEAKNTE